MSVKEQWRIFRLTGSMERHPRIVIDPDFTVYIAGKGGRTVLGHINKDVEGNPYPHFTAYDGDKSKEIVDLQEYCTKLSNAWNTIWRLKDSPEGKKYNS